MSKQSLTLRDKQSFSTNKHSLSSKKQSFQISYCIGVYNEEKILRKNIDRYIGELTTILGRNNFEVVLVQNGSRDRSAEILGSIKHPNVLGVSIKAKGHGLALKKAMEKSKFPYVVLTGMDIPFGFSDLKQAKKLFEQDKYDVIFGSKAHPKSIVGYPLSRRLLSFFFHSLMFILFRVKIKDPHGSVFIYKRKVRKFLELCDSPGSFFMSQLAIHGQRSGLRMTEIPVVLKESNNERKSSVRMFRDSFDTIIFIFREFSKLQKLK